MKILHPSHEKQPVKPSEGCKVCGALSRFFGTAILMGRHGVDYFECIDCGFIQTEEPFWLKEAYSNAITSSDIGYVYRNQLNQRVSRALISAFFKKGARFLDYGGGYGMLVRMMRDAGFDFFRSDLYCENLFAKGFDSGAKTSGFELVTAFEVFEHLVAPKEALADMLTFGSSVFFSTQLLPSPAPPLEDWWYFGLEHGQHVALHTRKSLQVLASLHKMNLLSDGHSLHLLTPRKIPEVLFRLAIRRGAFLLNLLNRQTSLLSSDFLALTGKQAM